MGIYTIRTSQLIPTSVTEVWDFISSPKNLQHITPAYMGFQIITDPLPQKIYPGMIIQYKVSPLLKIKLNWVTEITQLKDKECFIDEQRSGPYSIWHHQHHLIETKVGTLMNDIVTYQPPMKILGTLAHSLFIKKQLKEIFDYRKMAIEKRFGKA